MTNSATCTTEACTVSSDNEHQDMPPFIYEPSVAICTLADEALNEALLNEPKVQDAGVMVAPLRTENLGIEQIIEFSLGQPNLRFIILCGTDSRQSIGHLAGQSFMALQQHGVDQNGRIIGAEGRRPVLKNLTLEAIEAFRERVTLIDLVDKSDKALVLGLLQSTLAKKEAPFEPLPDDFKIKKDVPVYQAELPESMVSDAAGYCVIEVLPEKCAVSLTHYYNGGELNGVIEGASHKAIYCKAVELGWVSTLDHAAYLGRELYRAEDALNKHYTYIQDRLDLSVER